MDADDDKVSLSLLWLYLWGFSFTVASLEPGFLDFDNLPDTNFSCVGKVIGGYYADLETSCQMFHVCTIGQLDEPMDIRFLCLNGTVFDQETRVCERIDEVDCSKSEKFYSLNLELYGNTQPPILEDNTDTEPPDILKHSSSTTTTTTTPRPTKPKTTRPSFIITTTQKPPTTTLEEKFLQSHHFPGSNSADIRFNPEEINISLNPGAPPNIRPKPVSYQQSITDNNKRVIVTTHTTVYKNENSKPQLISTPDPQILETQKPKTIVNYDLNHDGPHPQPLVQSAGDDYNFESYHTEKILDYETEIPHHEISFRPSFRPSSRDIQHFTPKPEYKSSTYRNQYLTTTNNPVRIGYSQRGPTTYRNSYSSPLKPAMPYYHRTDKPPRIQIPLPLIPTLSPLTFSSPAPFSLNRHVESKRFTDHHQPPRIVISASASVSDASGRKFNYSLGTIGDSRFFGQAPHSYDDYKEDDVGLDPFYHDVPKLKRSRRMRHKRSAIETKQRTRSKPQERKVSKQAKSSQEDNKTARTKTQENSGNKRIKRRPKEKTEEEIKSEKEAIDVLKFLFNWYNSHEKMSETNIPINPETITEINKELSKINDEEYYYDDYDFTTKLELQSATPKSDDLTTKTGRIAKVIKNPKSTQTSNNYNISDGVISVTETQTEKSLKEKEEAQQVDRIDQMEYEYVDDNYEPQTYNHTKATNPRKDYDYEYLVDDKESSTGSNEELQSLKVENSDYESSTGNSNEYNKNKTENYNQNIDAESQNTGKPNYQNYDAESNKNQNFDLESETIRNDDYQSYDKEYIKNINENDRSYITDSIQQGFNAGNKRKNDDYQNKDAESNTRKIQDNHNYNTESNNNYQTYDLESTTRNNNDSSQDSDEIYNSESNSEASNYYLKSNTPQEDDFRSNVPGKSNNDLESITKNSNVDQNYDLESNVRNSNVDRERNVKNSNVDLESNVKNSNVDQNTDLESNVKNSNVDQNYDLESNEKNSNVDQNYDLESNEKNSNADQNYDLESNVRNSNVDLESNVKNSNVDLESNVKNSNVDQNYDLESNEKNSNADQNYDLESNVRNSNVDLESNVKNSNVDLESNVKNSNVDQNYDLESNAKKSNADQNYDLESNVKNSNVDLESNVKNSKVDLESNVKNSNVDQNYDLESNEKNSNADLNYDLASNADQESNVKNSNVDQNYDQKNKTSNNNDHGSYNQKDNSKSNTRNNVNQKTNFVQEINTNVYQSISNKNNNDNKSKTTVNDYQNTNFEQETKTNVYQSSNNKNNNDNESKNQNYDTDYENTNYEQPTITENLIASTTETTAATTETIQYEKVLKILGITTSKPTQNSTLDEIPILTTDVTTVSYDHNTEGDSTYHTVPKDVATVFDGVATTVFDGVTNTETTLNTVEFTTSEDLLTITQEGITARLEVETTTALPTTTTRKHGRGTRRNYSQNKRGKAKKYRKFVELVKEQSSSTITTENYPSTTPTTPDLPDITTKLLQFNENDYGIYSKEYKQDDLQDPQTTENQKTETTPTESTPHVITTGYDTTLNILYTTVQLQEFIEKVESNTNSIADTKNITKEDPTTELQITTTEITTPATTTTKRYESRVANSNRRNRYRGVHRFSVATTRKPRRKKPSITEEIVDVIKNRMDSTDESSTRKSSRRKKIDFNINAYTANLAYRNRKIETTIPVGKNAETTERMSASSTHLITSSTNEAILVNKATEDTSGTTASFSKSANPTIAKNPKDSLPTTPLSNSRNNLNFVFNCIGKAINKFYSDPRDCRLFHYCTKGFTKTQLLDMKFVCDLGTYFDSEKLICTKDRPTRCT